jgi:hypothetical protein
VKRQTYPEERQTYPIGFSAFPRRFQIFVIQIRVSQRFQPVSNPYPV